jgi:hypothetical protein
MVASALASHPDVPFPSQDRVIVADVETNRVVLTQKGPELPATTLLSEVSTDLEALSIRQFGLKWGITDEGSVLRRAH